MFLRFIITTICLFLIFSCSSDDGKEFSNLNNNNLANPETLYIQGMDKFNNAQYTEAVLIFKNIQKIYPLSNEAIQSQIMTGFVDYLLLDYDSAILKFDRLITKHPSLKNIDYVYYMKALCYYEQISHEGLDGKFNILALENLDQVINRFPDSKYAKDSYQKKILVKSNIAAKHITIARFYQEKEKYTAALNRYQIIVDDFSETKFTPEALYRISEIYYSIGMIEESSKTASILGHNYPDSEWYKYIYNNLTNENKGSILSKTYNKIFN